MAVDNMQEINNQPIQSESLSPGVDQPVETKNPLSFTRRQLILIGAVAGLVLLVFFSLGVRAGEKRALRSTPTPIPTPRVSEKSVPGGNSDLTQVLSLSEYCDHLVDIEIPKDGVSYDNNAKEITLKVKNIGDVDLAGFRTKISGYVGYEVKQVVVNNQIITNLKQWPPPDADSWDQCVISNSRFSTDEINLFETRVIKPGETFEAKIQADLPEFFSVSSQVEPRVKYVDITTSCEQKIVRPGKTDMPRRDDLEDCPPAPAAGVESRSKSK